MKHLLIIYHTQSGNTGQMAAAVLRGCQQETDVITRLLRAFDAGLSDLLWADGIVFGTPENFGTMSGALKDFFDRTYYPAEEHQLNLPYGFLSVPEMTAQGLCVKLTALPVATRYAKSMSH